MINLIIFILATYGFANALVNENIFSKLRKFIDKKFHYSALNKIFNCITCMGFYVGMVFGFLLPIEDPYIRIIIGGFIGSAICKIIDIKIIRF